MEFLIIVAVVAIGGYFGYKYYQARKVATNFQPTAPSYNITPEPVKDNVLVLTEGVKAVAETKEATVEVKAEPVTEAPSKPKRSKKAEASAEVAKTRSRAKGKFVGDDKSTPDVNEAFKDGKAPAKKKKPNIKVAK